MKKINLDNAAATPIDDRVMKAMNKAMQMDGNPSSYNNSGREAAALLAQSRQRVAKFLNARAEEVVFTGSGSEANTLAILGVVRRWCTQKRNSILTTPIEHQSVLQAAQQATREGAEVHLTPVSKEGVISVDDIQRLFSKKTLLVSVMYANNEIGTIQPIREIGKVVADFRKKHNSEFPLFHVDACQASEYLPMDVHALGVDLLSFNGSKVYGPRGIGVLYVRRGVALTPLIFGGGQEGGRRAGTENVPAIAGLARALDLVTPREKERVQNLRDYFLNALPEVLPVARINGSLVKRLPNNINISIPGVDSENLLLELEKYGIAAGSGSACTARQVEPSHVLEALGLSKDYLQGVLRLSLGRSTTKADMTYVLKVLPKVVRELTDRYTLHSS